MRTQRRTAGRHRNRKTAPTAHNERHAFQQQPKKNLFKKNTLRPTKNETKNKETQQIPFDEEPITAVGTFLCRNKSIAHPLRGFPNQKKAKEERRNKKEANQSEFYPMNTEGNFGRIEFPF